MRGLFYECALIQNRRYGSLLNWGVGAAINVCCFLATALAAGKVREAYYPPSVASLGFAVRDQYQTSACNVGDLDGDGSEEILLLREVPDFPFVILYSSTEAAGTLDWNDPVFRPTKFRPFGVFADPDFAFPAGDVDADGFGDFILGSFRFNVPSTGTALLLVFGGPYLKDEREIEIAEEIELPLRATWILSPPESPFLFGVDPDLLASGSFRKFAYAGNGSGGGDFNGDGIDDFVVDIKHTDEGRKIFVIFGRTQWPSSAGINELLQNGGGYLFRGPIPELRYPTEAHVLGDMDGDSLSELGISFVAREAGGVPQYFSWVLFGGTVSQGTQLDPQAPPNGVWQLEDCLIFGGCKDMDGDGLSELLGGYMTSSGTIRGYVVWGATREALLQVQGPSDMKAPAGSLISDLPFSGSGPQALLDPGVSSLRSVGDFDGDGTEDVLVAWAGRAVHFCELYEPAAAGQAALIKGSRTRPPELTPSSPYFEGFHRGEHMGGTGFGLRVGGKSLLVLAWAPGSAPPIAPELAAIPRVLTAVALFPEAGEILSASKMVQLSFRKVVILGAGFDDTTSVYFGEREAQKVSTVSRSVIIAEVPPGDPGCTVDVVLRKGALEAKLTAAFTYPAIDPPEQIPLVAAPSSGVGRLYSSDTDVWINGAVMTNDVNGDGEPEVVVQLLENSATSFLIVKGEAVLSGQIDVASTTPAELCRFTIPVTWRFNSEMATGDVDGDGTPDLILGSRSSPPPPTCTLVYGGPHLKGRLTLDPRKDFLVIEGPSDLPPVPPIRTFVLTPGDLTGDGIVDIFFRWLFVDSSGVSHETGAVVLGGPGLGGGGSLIAEDLAAEGRALVVEELFQAAPIGDAYEDGLADVLLVGSVPWALGYNLALTSVDFGSVRGKMDFGELVASTQADLVFMPRGSGRPRLPRWGPVTFDRSGNQGTHVLFPGFSERAGLLMSFFVAEWPNIPTVLLGFLEPGSDVGLLFDGQFIAMRDFTYSGLTTPGDFNGDGADDLLLPVAQDGKNQLLLVEGASLISGDNRTVEELGAQGVLLTAESMEAASGGNSKCDLNADGYDDLLVAFRSHAGSWEVFAVRGRPGPIAELEVRPEVVQFRRGDANSDGDLNLADAVFTLQYLFGGGPEPTCLRAADSNADQRLNLGDAIRTLSFLFGGGDPLPPPFERCGFPGQGGGGSLSCRSFPPCER